MNEKTSLFSKLITVLLVLGMFVLVLYIAFFQEKNDYVELKDVDLSKYTLSRVNVADVYLNDPSEKPNGTMFFENSSGKILRVKLKEANIQGEFKTDELGTFSLSFYVEDQTPITANYNVVYRKVYFEGDNLYLSIYDPLEIDKIPLVCTDYYNLVVKTITLDQVFEKTDFSVNNVSEYVNLARGEYEGTSVEVFYKVGFVGYGYSYVGKVPFVDGEVSYSLDNFKLTLEEGKTNRGNGTFSVSTQNVSDSQELNTSTLSFSWTLDLTQGNVLVLTFDDGKTATYNFSNHVLSIGKEIFSSASDLSFVLQLNSIN